MTLEQKIKKILEPFYCELNTPETRHKIKYILERELNLKFHIDIDPNGCLNINLLESEKYYNNKYKLQQIIDAE